MDARHFHQSRGFTLVEILLVISLISVLSIFFINNSTSQLRNQLIDQALTMSIDIKRASLRFFVDREGVWPGQASGCSAEAVLEDLRPYIGDIPENPWGGQITFECPELVVETENPTDTTTELNSIEPQQSQTFVPSFIIRQPVPSESLGQLLVRRMPGSQLDALVQGFIWNTFVSMAILPQAVSYLSEVVEDEGGYSFIPRSCPNGLTPQAMILPQTLCADPASGSLLGYRIQTTEIESNFPLTPRRIEIETLGADGRWTSSLDHCQNSIQPQIFKYCS